MLASLNHPNIATIHGLEQSDGVHYLVMELVPGDILAERLKRGPLKTDEASKIMVQIAEAVEAAHEKGVIHRDLKLANVKVTPEGRVKVLDFGLAKAFGGDGGLGLPHASTLTAMGTEEGRILGTPAYMSPEQARGKPVDKRTDIWAFGCIFYELLAGKQAFRGETATDTIAALLEREPDWQALPPATPAKIRDLLRRCLQKDSQRRLRDIGDARLEIEELLAAPEGTKSGNAVATGGTESWRHAPFWLTICFFLVAVTAIITWKLKPPSPSIPRSVAHFLLPMPAGVQLDTNFGSSIALSPDGSHLAFVAGRGATKWLYLREIRGTETKLLPGTEGATQPFFSPDGKWLAFFEDGKLEKVPTNGGPATQLSDASSGRGGSWGDNDTIVFSPQGRGRGILQVSADGGVPKPITTLDTGKGETSHRNPELLPGGTTVIFTVYGATYQDVSIVAESLKTGERRVLIEGASQPRYVSTGHLLYTQPKFPGTIMAVAFDPKSMKVGGPPVPMIEDVLTTRGDNAQWSVSRSGMLVYSPGGFQEPENNLVWVDREGAVEQLTAPTGRPYELPRLSPDGRKIVVSLQAVQSSLWTYDLLDKTFTRLTFEGNNSWPVWTPDGKRVTYASNRSEPWHLFWKPADGSGNEEMLLARRPGDQEPYSWSPDGKVLAYLDTGPSTKQDVWLLSTDGERRSRPFLQTASSELDAKFSPDGHWIAYASDESGRYEIYVQPFPGAGGKWQISTDGGREPVWARSGRALFYRNGEKMMMTDVATQPGFQFTSPRVLFQGPYETTSSVSPNYDVSADGQRFLMVQTSKQRPVATEFNVVLNWFDELKRLVPTEAR